jgi:ankyrin repeat protein
VPSDLKGCIDRGDVEALRAWLDTEPDLVRARIVWGEGGRLVDPLLVYVVQAPFHGACRGGAALEIARALLDAGADPDERGANGETALHGAVSLYEPELAELLIDRGADLEAAGGCIAPGTPLALAVHFASTECVDLLLERGARVPTLPLAAGAGDREAVQRLLPDATLEERARARLYAALHERMGLLELLLADADLAEPIDDATLLHWAAWWGRAESVRRLLEHGADRAARDARYRATPLEWIGVQLSRAGHARVLGDRLRETAEVLRA